jgi:hypothetical protein
MTDRLGRLLLVTLEGARLDADLPMLAVLRSWLDSWQGLDAVERGMPARGSISSSRGTTRSWRATFYTTGMEHSPTSATGTGWERTPWPATQRAAWEALRQVSAVG